MGKFVLWSPRVIAAILIIFTSLFAISGFVPGTSRMDNSLSLLIGLLPALIFLLALILAWFYKLAGGITFIALGVVMNILPRTLSRELSFLSLALPVLVVGILFLLSHFYEKSGSAR